MENEVNVSTAVEVETKSLMLEIPASTVHLADSYIRIASKNRKVFPNVESAIQQALAFGVEELTRRETRLAITHAKDAYFKDKSELDRMYSTLKGSKSPMGFEDYVERLRKIEQKHGIGFTQA